MIDFEALKEAMEEAAALRHPQRTMRVTLECAHLLLMPQINTVMGIGAFTGCKVCSGDAADSVTRMVVNVEETGQLHDSWRPKEKS